MSDETPTLPPASDDATLAPAEATPDPSTLLQGGDLPLPFTLGRYRLDLQLGKGGMGAVYRAEDTQLGRTVALKVPFLSGPQAKAIRARFLAEARSAAALAHANICPLYDLGEIDGVPFITMAFIRGKPLSKLVGRDAPFEPRQAATLVRKVALALAEAHSRGVIHRDLKPANIMIDERGEPIVMDFGLARRADAALALTQQGDVLGTPAFMPPEQINGETDRIGPASDQYSLGVVFYQLLTGDLPYHGDLIALVTQINDGAFTPPSRKRPGLDPRCDAVCLKAMAVRVEHRYASMADFAAGLATLGDAPGPALALTAPPSGVAGGLTLRVPGTPVVYRPLPGQALVRVGRQKRKPGEPPDQGNDVVVRIPNNDSLSARISRRHLELSRQDETWHVTDRSKVGTLLNGKPLPPGVARPIQSGDRLVLAGVLTLEVDLGPMQEGQKQAELDVVGEGGARVVLEATLGDMMTLA